MMARESSTALPGRRRAHQWLAVDGVIGVSIVLMVVTVAWINDMGSPGRLGLLVASWGLVSFAVTRGVLAKRRAGRPG
jgi:hypothetical protein